MRSNELYNEIIKNKGKKEEDWKTFANLLLVEKGNKNLVKAINESLYYNSKNGLIYDILDFIMEIGRESENAKQIFNSDLPSKFSDILNKETTDKNIKIKILFLIQKWGNMKDHGFEKLYKTLNNKGILFPPKNFHPDNIQYFKNQTENEKDNSNNKYPIYNNQINSNISSRVNNHNIYNYNKNNNNYLNNNPNNNYNNNIFDNKNMFNTRKNDGFNKGSDNIEDLYYNQYYGSLSARNNNRENDFKKTNEYRVIQETRKMKKKYPDYEAKNRSYSENLDFYVNNNQ